MALIFVPYLFSFILGTLAVHILYRNGPRLSLTMNLFVSCGAGMGLSSLIAFLVLIMGGQMNKAVMIILHIVLILALLAVFVLINRNRKKESQSLPHADLPALAGIIGILLFFIPVIYYARFYPHGGWDAWNVWNFKAKFLLLAGENWGNLFDPILWRSSPHYPLLLPLSNVWGWCFSSAPVSVVPMTTGLVYLFLLCGLLFIGIYEITRNPAAILAPLLILSQPFCALLSISQYSDIVLSYYLLGAAILLLRMIRLRSIPDALLAGLFLGFLSFSKSEGAAAAIFLLLIGSVQILLTKQPRKRTPSARTLLACLAGALAIGILPNALFYFFYSPGNQTFINGLSSETNPVSLYRLKMIFAYTAVELTSAKWHGLWICLGAGLILGILKCCRRGLVLIPAFILSYLLLIFTYYFINTYFEIGWWLQVTLHRILFALLPLFIFWIFTSVLMNKDGKERS